MHYTSRSNDWVPMRAIYAGNCIECATRFAKGSQIEWDPVSRRCRCDYCARGIDPAKATLTRAERAIVHSNLDDLSRLISLPRPRSAAVRQQIHNAIKTLQDFKFLRVVRTALNKAEQQLDDQ